MARVAVQLLHVHNLHALCGFELEVLSHSLQSYFQYIRPVSIPETRQVDIPANNYPHFSHPLRQLIGNDSIDGTDPVQQKQQGPGILHCIGMSAGDIYQYLGVAN
jgi:hypothetical protein